MKRLLAALVGFALFCVCLVALAEGLDDDFAEAFEGFRVDPFSDFEPDFEDIDPSDYEDPFADDEDDDATYGNAYMSFDSSSFEEDEEDPFADPENDMPSADAGQAAQGSGSLRANINGEALELKFDASPTYSSIEGHLLQAAFYTYGAASGSLYEMFVSFPDSVQAGDSITPEIAITSALDTSLVLLISTATEDTFYVATQQSGSGPYPETSSYTLHIDTVTRNGDSVTYTGSFTADMVSYSQKSGKIDKTLRIENATFEFTMGSANSKDAGDSQDDAPSADPFDSFTDFPTIAPDPTPTAAPDFRKV